MKNSNYHPPIIRFYAKLGTPETLFFISLVCLFFIPFITEIQNHILNAILVSFFILSLYYLIDVLNPKRKKLFIAPLLLTLIITWLKHFDFDIPFFVDSLFQVLIMVISFYFIFKSVFNKESIDINTLMAAISGYLLIGISFGLIVFAFASIYPQSFSFKEEINMHDTYYYSFVTMSTLGYGDIVPLTVRAKGLSILITLMGQFYMAIVIGLIIGKLISREELKLNE